MNTKSTDNKIEIIESNVEEFAQSMSELSELELSLVGGGTGAVIWA